MTSPRTTQAVLDHHLQSFGAYDVEEILADFSDDSALVLPEVVIRGRDAIRGFFTQAFDEFRQPGTTSKMIATHVVGDCAFVVWSAETKANTYELASDTLVVRNGVIEVQTFAAKVTPKT